MAIRAKHARRRWADLALAAMSLALGAALSACHTPKGSEWLPYGREIEALNRHLEEQFRAGNLLGVADVYADDAMLLDERGTRVAGRQEIDEYWSGIEDPVDWKLEIRSIYGSDSLAYELGRSHLTTRRDGVLQTSVVDFLVLWRREPSREWRIVLDAYWPREEP